MLEKYNLRRHYEDLHAYKSQNLQGQQRKEKVNELLAALKKQQSVFTRSWEVSDAAVKASYPFTHGIALASKPFSEGEFVKTCFIKATETVCPEKRQALANISVTRNTVAHKIAHGVGANDGDHNSS